MTVVDMTNLPNILTFIRIATIPFLVVIFYLPVSWGHTAAAIIFALAALTDWLDGYLARNLKQSTRLGAFLDPVADKLMVSIALVLIVGEPQFQFITIPAAIIVSREIIVSALREWMADIGKRASVAVSRLAKTKTAMQMISLVILLYCTPTSPLFITIVGYILLYIAAILTLWSMVIYLKVAWPELRNQCD